MEKAAKKTRNNNKIMSEKYEELKTRWEETKKTFENVNLFKRN